MKKSIFLAMAAVAAVVLAGCVKEDVTEVATDGGRSVTLNLIESRTTLEYPDGEDAASMLVWNAGDQVSYFISTDDGVTYSVAANAEVVGGGKVTLTENLPEEGAFKVKVVYPAQAAGSAYEAAVIPAVQNQSGAAMNGTYLPMEGEGAVEAGATTADLLYSVKGAVIRLKLSATAHADETVKKVALYNESGVMANNSKVVSVAANAQLSGEDYVYAVVDAGTYAPTVQVLTDKASYTYNGTFNEKAFAAGNMYRYSLNLDGEGKTTRVLALDGEDTANCYLVQAGGTYSFDANIKGNGVNPIGTAAQPILSANYDSYAADWLWATAAGVVSDIAYDPVWKRITLTVPETLVEGSNIVALYNTTSKEIAWSWHIWVNSTVEDVAYSAAAGTWLSANLGAKNSTMDDAGSYGHLYQWGRKDPIVGAGVVGTAAGAADTSKFDSATASYVANTTVFGEMAWASDAIATVADCHKLPMTMASAVVGDETENAWITPAPGYGKTLNDPCPVGYRIPSNNNMSNLATALSGLGTPAADNEKATLSSVTYSRVYTYADTADLYPAAGVRLKSGQIKNVGKFGMYWNAGSVNFQLCGTTNNIKFISAGSSGKQPHTSALSVRCRKEAKTN